MSYITTLHSKRGLALLLCLTILFWTQSAFAITNTQSIDFETNSSQYVSISDANQSGLDITGDISIEAWIKLESSGTGYGIVWKNTNNGNNAGYMMQLEETGGALRLHMRVSDGSKIAYSYGNTDFDHFVGKWVHVAGTWDAGIGNVPKLYVNGVENTLYLSNNNGVSSIGNNSEPTYIGRGNTGGTWRYFDGLVDEVRIWNDVRTADEIISNTNVALEGNESNLQAYWNLNAVATDMTSNDNTLSFSGSPSYSEEPANAWCSLDGLF